MSTYDKVIKLYHQKRKADTQLPSTDLRDMAAAICETFDKELRKLELKKH